MARTLSIAGRRIALLSGGMFVLFCFALLSLRAGAVEVPWSDFFALISGREAGDPILQTVLYELRLPRVLFAIIVGGALALSGAVMQALFRNPLAEPTLIGISSGASLGAVTALLFGFGSVLATGLAGFTGAMVATVAAYVVGRRMTPFVSAASY